jgi:hypothetical protein
MCLIFTHVSTTTKQESVQSTCTNSHDSIAQQHELQEQALSSMLIESWTDGLVFYVKKKYEEYGQGIRIN